MAQDRGRGARIATRVSRALRAYIAGQQRRAKIPRTQRDLLTILHGPRKPILIQGRWRKSPPVALRIVIALLLFAALVKFAEERRA